MSELVFKHTRPEKEIKVFLVDKANHCYLQMMYLLVIRECKTTDELLELVIKNIECKINMRKYGILLYALSKIFICLSVASQKKKKTSKY